MNDFRVKDFVFDASSAPAYDQHERVSFIEDPNTGLRAFIAIHNTQLGPAVGGCRFYDYASKDQALEDVLRLSRGMTYKSALADLPMGGGKAVIIGNPRKQKSAALLQAMGRFIDSHQGNYVTAEDSGTSVSDMAQIARATNHVLGHETDQAFGGDPSPLTAQGVFNGIEAAVEFSTGSKNMQDMRVAVQGAGSVGSHLINELIQAGAKVVAADINESNAKRALELGADLVSVDDIHKQEVDVFAPCAMGAILNDVTIPELKAEIIAGAANNQLAKPYHAKILKARGIVYVPDFVVNAGGIIEIYRQFKSVSEQEAKQRIDRIGSTVTTILQRAVELDLDTDQVAEAMAEERFLPTLESNSGVEEKAVELAALVDTAA